MGHIISRQSTDRAARRNLVFGAPLSLALAMALAFLPKKKHLEKHPTKPHHILRARFNVRRSGNGRVFLWELNPGERAREKNRVESKPRRKKRRKKLSRQSAFVLPRSVTREGASVAATRTLQAGTPHRRTLALSFPMATDHGGWINAGQTRRLHLRHVCFPRRAVPPRPSTFPRLFLL